MQNDVFISYSRKDTEVANQICKAFDEVGITYFIDRQGISGGFEFPTVLAEAIVNCRIFLYLASKNSYESKFTQAEITFAFNKKERGNILPYIIDGSNLPLSLEFVFSAINWRRIENDPIEPVLIDDLLNLLGKKRLSHISLAELSEEQRRIENDSTEFYKVGDICDIDGVKGIVFQIWDGGKHGKVVSIDQAKLQWCSSKQYEKEIIVGATSVRDGKINTDKIISYGEENEYPATYWCRNKGDKWYLPAIDELTLLLLDDQTHDIVNQTLNRLNASLLLNKGDNEMYWSSSEAPNVDRYELTAWTIYMDDGETFADMTDCNNLVRAIAAF